MQHVCIPAPGNTLKVISHFAFLASDACDFLTHATRLYACVRTHAGNASHAAELVRLNFVCIPIGVKFEIAPASDACEHACEGMDTHALTHVDAGDAEHAKCEMTFSHRSKMITNFPNLYPEV